MSTHEEIVSPEGLHQLRLRLHGAEGPAELFEVGKEMLAIIEKSMARDGGDFGRKIMAAVGDVVKLSPNGDAVLAGNIIKEDVAVHLVGGVDKRAFVTIRLEVLPVEPIR